MKSLVNLAEYSQVKTAHFLREKLEEKGIDCYLSYVSDPEVRALRTRVQIKGEDVENAVRIMLGIKESLGKNIEDLDPSAPAYKILVPTNFSKGSENAAYYALHLAKQIQAEMKILHVYENPLSGVDINKTSTFENYALSTILEVEENAKTGLMEFMNRIKTYGTKHGLGEIQMLPASIMGRVVNRISEIAEVYQPDFLVLGTEGKKEGSRSVLGGLGMNMIQKLELPLFAVPEAFIPHEHQKMNILYATDFNEKDHNSLNRLLHLLSPFDIEITCIHIETEPDLQMEERMDELNFFLARNYRSHRIQCRLIEDKDVFHGIQQYTDSNKINLLSFTTRKKHIFEKLFRPNLFKKILQEARVPILIFPS